MTAQIDWLARFEDRKTRVLGFAQALTTIAAEQKDEQAVHVLEDFVARFRENKFLVLVVGDFKTGKSTLVNALVSRTICPVRARPRTAKITRLTATEHAEGHEYVDIHFRDDAPTERVALIDADLNQLVAVDGKRTQDVQLVDVHMVPGKTILRHHVRIVDTPGLGSADEGHSRITRDYMEHADVLVFVFSASKAFTESERDFLLTFRQVMGRTIFVVNQIDRVPEDERAEVIEHIQASLLKYVVEPGVAAPAILPLSSEQALAALKVGDATDELTESGFPTIVAELERRLADQHGAVVLRGIASQEREVCASLSRQAALSRDLLAVSRTQAEAFAKRKAAVVADLAASACEKANVVDKIATRPDALLPAVTQFLGQWNVMLRGRVSQWLSRCSSEEACKRDLPAFLAKEIADGMTGFDQRLAVEYEKLSTESRRTLSAIFKRMEARVRELTPDAPTAAVGELSSGYAALAALSAVASGVGGSTGGYGVATTALKKALAPSPVVQALSVATGVASIIGAFAGPAGWIIAGITGFFAALLGISHASTWRERVLARVGERIEAEVMPRIEDVAAQSIRTFCAGLSSDVEQETGDVLQRLTTTVEEAARKVAQEDAAKAKEMKRLVRLHERAEAIASDIAAFLSELPEPQAPAESAEPLQQVTEVVA